jgi:hypothetical protein
MKKAFFRWSGNAVCIASGVLLSVLEAQLFSDSPYLRFLFAAILCATVLIVFVYFISGNSAVFLMLYTIILTYILDILDKNVDIRVLLACLACLGLLYAQSHFRANSERFCTPDPAFGAYFLILLICFALAAFSAFWIVHNVLEPRLPERELTLLQQIEEEIQAPESTPPPSQDTQGGGGGQGGGGAPAAFPWHLLLRAIPAVLGLALAALLLWLLFLRVRYRLWLRRTRRAPLSRQLCEFYRYILCALALYGYPRQAQETPFEYLRVTQNGDFPLPPEKFAAVSRAFVATSFGEKSVSPADHQACLALFRLISVNFKKSLGLRRYTLRYLVKMHGVHGFWQ